MYGKYLPEPCGRSNVPSVHREGERTSARAGTAGIFVSAVLLKEPISPKVNVSLSQHDLKPCSHENSVPLEQFDITPDALVLTMTFSEKVAYLEKYEGGEVYTLGEYVGVDTDIVDPYGGEDEQYDLCYHEIGRRIRKVIQILMENEKDEGGQAE